MGNPGTPATPVDGRTELQLPGEAFFPQSLYALKDGTIFVGGIATGEVVKFAPGAETPQEIVAPGTPSVAIGGLYADENASTLYVCADHFPGPGFANPEGELRTYDYTGKLGQAYKLPVGSLCSDITMDGKKNVYVADPFMGNVFVLKSGATALAVWSSDAALKPDASKDPLGVGVHGIDFDGDKSLYMDNWNRATVLRITIQSDGSAGPVINIATSRPVSHPEGLRVLDTKTVVIAEDENPTGRLTKLTLADETSAAATATTLKNGLENPTSFGITQGSYWVAEGQIAHLFDPNSGPPNLPFLVQRVVEE